MKTWLLCLPLLLPVAALAQFKCTMPSGVVIFSHLSACPADAVKSEPIEQVPDSVQPQFKGVYREPPPVPARPPAPLPAPPPVPARPAVERNVATEAQQICARLMAGGATSCEIDLNIFSPSVIDVTWPTTPREAQMICLTVANMTRQPGSPFVGRGWQLKLFSPIGSGTRPMAQCTL